MILCNFLAAGPTLAIAQTAMDFFPNWKETGLDGPIAKTAYFFNCTALFQGLGNLLWMPLINKYGRRAVYVAAFTLYTITAVWCAVATQYANFLVGRIFMGIAAGAGECLAPVTISDIFFLHQRGTVTAYVLLIFLLKIHLLYALLTVSLYTASLNLGVASGAIVDGFIVKLHPWRYIYYVAIALIGTVTIIIYFTFPETSYNRSPHTQGITTTLHSESGAYHDKVQNDDGNFSYIQRVPSAAMKPHKFLLDGLKLDHGTFTEESLWAMALRPVLLLALPPVLWATLVMSVTIGFITAITSNVAPAYASAYGFEAWQAGLCFFAGVIGALLGIVLGGNLSDWVADFFTKRNNGVREPEMRLPAIMISVITGPLALALYGVGINNKLHWMVPTIAIGLSTCHLVFCFVSGVCCVRLLTI